MLMINSEFILIAKKNNPTKLFLIDETLLMSMIILHAKFKNGLLTLQQLNVQKPAAAFLGVLQDFALVF